MLLVRNLNAVKAPGVAVAAALRAHADEVIE